MRVHRTHRRSKKRVVEMAPVSVCRRPGWSFGRRACGMPRPPPVARVVILLTPINQLAGIKPNVVRVFVVVVVVVRRLVNDAFAFSANNLQNSSRSRLFVRRDEETVLRCVVVELSRNLCFYSYVGLFLRDNNWFMRYYYDVSRCCGMVISLSVWVNTGALWWNCWTQPKYTALLLLPRDAMPCLPSLRGRAPVSPNFGCSLVFMAKSFNAE